MFGNCSIVFETLKLNNIDNTNLDILEALCSLNLVLCLFLPQEWGRAVSSCDSQTTHFQVRGSTSATVATFPNVVVVSH